MGIVVILVLAAVLAAWQLWPRAGQSTGGTGQAGRPGPQGALLAAATLASPFTPSGLDAVVESALKKQRGDYRGVYLSAPGASTPSIYDTTVHLIERTELNAVVIDVKADGRVYFDAQNPFVKSVGNVHPVLKNIKAQLADLKSKHIYTIARIVTFKDPGLAKAHPEWAIQDKRGGVWKDSGGQAWMDAYNINNWKYNIDIAVEAAQLGFDEIQFDYVRFPSDGKISETSYPDAKGRTRVDAISGFLEAARAALDPLGVAVSADIFGLIPTAHNDQGIGQHWEEVTASLDYASPMEYPSHYAAHTYGIPDPNSSPGPTVTNTMQDAISRTVTWGAATRPWLQDFSLFGVHYTPPMVRAQIDAAEKNGALGWLLWNAANCYKPDALKPDLNATPLPKFGDENTCSAAVRTALNGTE